MMQSRGASLISFSNEISLYLLVPILKETPEKHFFNQGKWTGPLLVQWIKTEYALEYQKAQVYNLLVKVGIAFEKKTGLVYKM